MLKANELSPADPAIKHDLDYVTSLFQAQQHRQSSAEETTTNVQKGDDSTMIDATGPNGGDTSKFNSVTNIENALL